MSQFIVNIDGSVEQDKVFLCDRLLNIKGQIAPISDLRVAMRLNQNDEVSFRLYKYNNGNIHPLWDEIDDIGIIFVEGKGYFEIGTPLTDEGVVYKEISGVSLGEAETSQTNVTLEINTEDDIARTDYVQTMLYNSTEHEGSLLHRIFKKMPHYSIGHVDASVATMIREFSCQDTPIYDFLQTIAEELECIFVFDNFSRTVNCYDLKDHCNRQMCISAGKNREVKNGVCTCCNSSQYIIYGYGEDTGVFIDSGNLAENITLTGDKDSVKNTFKIVGGDEEITNRLENRLMDGDTITKFSEHQISQMSPELQQALIDHDALVQSYQDEYNSLWDSWNQKNDKILYYESSMMPSLSTSGTTASTVFDEIQRKITKCFKTSQYQDGESVMRSVKTLAGWIAPKQYNMDFTLNSYSGNIISIKVSIKLRDAYKDTSTKEETSDSHSGTLTLPVLNGYTLSTSKDSDGNPIYTNEYFQYLQQQLEMALERSDVNDELVSFNPPVTSATGTFDPNAYASHSETDTSLPTNHYTKFSINRLQSFKDAYEGCSKILSGLNSSIAAGGSTIAPKDDSPANSLGVSVLRYITESGSIGNIRDDLMGKYANYIQCIDARMKYLDGLVESNKNDMVSLKSRIDTIKSTCNMESYMKNYSNGKYGDDLWIELCSFRREDVYTNDNYFSEGLSEEQIMENLEMLIRRAKEELEKACEISYSINTTVGNLLTMTEFQQFWDKFTMGNWINCRIDEDIYRLRLIGVTFQYGDLSHIDVEFSDVTKTKNPIADIKSILAQASSISSNFNSVSRQAANGNTAGQQLLMMKEHGLDVANTMITNANKQEMKINEHGLVGRVWNDTKNGYDDEQVAIINNLLCFTSDSWKHTHLALGKILFYNEEANNGAGAYEWAYGLNAEILISNLILSEKMKIYNKSGTFSMTDDGFLMSKNKNYIKFLPDNPDTHLPSMQFGTDTKSLLEFNTKDHKNELWISGNIEASNIKGGNISSLDGNSFFDIDNSQLVFSGKGEIISHNYDGSECLRIAEGVLTFGEWINGSFDNSNKSLLVDNDGFTIGDYNVVVSKTKGIYVDIECQNAAPLIIMDKRQIIPNQDRTMFFFQTGSAYALTSLITNNKLTLMASNGDSSLGSSIFPWGELHLKSGSTTTSDLKKKNIISTIDKDKALDFINGLSPINYTFKDSENKRVHMGFGAQPVAELAKDLDMGDLSLYEAAYIKDNKEYYYQDDIDDKDLSWGLKYTEFIAPMVASIQKLSSIIEQQQNEINELKTTIQNYRLS